MYRKINLFLTMVLVLKSLVNMAIAGLNEDHLVDDVIAVYHFENTMDSGPRDFHGDLTEEASIIKKGKIGKCLQLKDDGSFGTTNTHNFGIVDGEFSVVAWVKLSNKNDAFEISILSFKKDSAEAPLTVFGGIQLNITPLGIIGIETDFKDDISETITSKKKVANNKWHHIAFTRSADIYTLYIDGKKVKRERSNVFLSFIGDSTLIYIRGLANENRGNTTYLRGSVFVDEVGFYEKGFSVYEIEGLYNDGLSDFMDAMPVSSRDKITTTWGALKSGARNSTR